MSNTRKKPADQPGNVWPLPAFATHATIYRNLGYSTLQIAPPDSGVENAGKCPARLLHGEWQPEANWTRHLNKPMGDGEIERRAKKGGGVGILTGQRLATSKGDAHLIGIDIDVDGDGDFDKVRTGLLSLLPKKRTPEKRGKRGSTLLALVTEYPEPFGGQKYSGDMGAIQLLAENNQTVMPPSVHPETGKPYEWINDSGLVAIAKLPVVAYADLVAAIRSMGFDRGEGAGSATADDKREINDLSDYVASVETGDADIQEAITALEQSRDVRLTDLWQRGDKAKHAPKDGSHSGLRFELARLLHLKGFEFDTFVQLCFKWEFAGDYDDRSLAREWHNSKRNSDKITNAGSDFGALDDPLRRGQSEAADDAADPKKQERIKEARDLGIVARLPADLDAEPEGVELVEGLQYMGDLGVVYGRPSALKSFHELHKAMSVATKQEFYLGRRIMKQGCVAIISREGHRSFRRRMRAWGKAYNVDVSNAPVALIKEPVNLTIAKYVTAIGLAIRDLEQRTGLPCVLIIIDTLARATPGMKENDVDGMSIAVDASGRLQTQIGCVVDIVQHENKGGGLRGSTALEGAADLIVHVQRKEHDMHGVLSIEKVKDGEDGYDIEFTVETHDIDGKSSLAIKTGSRPLPKHKNKDRSAAIQTDELVKCRMLRRIEEAWNQGKPWSPHPQSSRNGTYAAMNLAQEFKLDMGKAKALIAGWLTPAQGVLQNVEEYAERGKHKTSSLRVLIDLDAYEKSLSGFGSMKAENKPNESEKSISRESLNDDAEFRNFLN